jgi:ZIP family zinc transporter
MTKRCDSVAHILISAAERQRAVAPQHLLHLLPPVGRPSAPGEAHEAGTAALKSLLLLAFHHGGQGHWCRAVPLQLGDKRHCGSPLPARTRTPLPAPRNGTSGEFAPFFSRFSSGKDPHALREMRRCGISALGLLVGACSVAALPAALQAEPTRALAGPSPAVMASSPAPLLLPGPHAVGEWPLEGSTAAMRLRGGGEGSTSSIGGNEQHRHAVLAEQMGLGSHAYVLPLLYSMLAGLSTGVGGLLCLLMRGNAAMEVPVTAFMLATAAAAMITVSIVDLFMHIAEEIGLQHTLYMSISGAVVVVLAKKLGSFMFGTPEPSGSEKAEDSQKKKSERRLLRVGLLTAVTLTAHNLPEGMAVAISTMGSVNLGLKLAVAIALHNIPEGLAIACPLIMSKRYSPAAAIGIAFASGLSEPVGALLTLLVLQTVITQERIDYALAFVGGVMMAVASLELMPEALRLQRLDMTVSGFITGVFVMGTSLYVLG